MSEDPKTFQMKYLVKTIQSIQYCHYLITSLKHLSVLSVMCDSQKKFLLFIENLSHNQQMESMPRSSGLEWEHALKSYTSVTTYITNCIFFPGVRGQGTPHVLLFGGKALAAALTTYVYEVNLKLDICLWSQSETWAIHCNVYMFYK